MDRVMELSDAEVIERSLDRPEVFAAIFERHFEAIYRYLSRRLGPSLADDFAGQVFLTAFDRRDTYKEMHPTAAPWLYGIATNVVRRHVRDEQRKVRAMDRLLARFVVEEAVDGQERVDAAGAARDDAAKLPEALSGLLVGERDALLLHVVEQLSYDEIAAALDVPIGTVRSRIHRARRRLREALYGPSPVTCGHLLGGS